MSRLGVEASPSDDDGLRAEHMALGDAFRRCEKAAADEREAIIAELGRRHPDAAQRLRRMLETAPPPLLEAPLVDLHGIAPGVPVVSGCDDSGIGDSGPGALGPRALGPRALGPGALGPAALGPAAPASTPPSDGDRPIHVGHYRILGLLGSGSSAEVFEAESTRAPLRRVALKVLRTGLFDGERRWRLERECEALSDLVHPNVATLFEAGVDAGRPWLAMELVRGLPLHRWAAMARPEPTAAAVLMARVCDGVHALHQRGAIHRDIKPANIMVAESPLDPSTGEPVPKIIDLGLARLEAGRGDSLRTRTEAVLGTLGYLAPEALAGRNDLVDVRSDVYSLGVVLFELVAGERPAQAGTADSGSPPSLRRVVRSCPWELDAVAAKALAARREDRYSSVAAMAEDLRRVVDRRPVLARRSGWVRTLVLAARRNRALTMLVVACLGLLIGMAGLFLERAVEQARRHAEDRRLVVQLVEEVVYGLREVAGSDPSAAAAARTAGAILARLADSDPRDLELRLLQARLRSWQAGALRERGDVEQAARAWSESLAIIDGALGEAAAWKAASDPSVSPDGAGDQLRNQLRDQILDQIRGERSITLVKLGECARDRGDRAEMDLRFREALAIDQAMADALPDDASRVARLAYSFERLSHAAQEQGRIADSVALHDRQGETIAAWERLDPQGVGPRRARCAWFLRGAWYAERRGDASDEERCFREAVRLARALVHEDRDGGSWNRVDMELLALATGGLGLTLGATGRTDEALAIAAEPLPMLTAMAETETQRSFARALLASRQWLLSRVLEDGGRFEEAAEQVRRAISTLDEAIRMAPDRADHQLDRSAYQERLALHLRRLGRRDEAVAVIRHAIDSAQAATALSDASPTWLRLAWLRLSPELAEVRDLEGGVAAARRAVERDPSHWQAIHCLAVALAEAGHHDDAAAQAAAALSMLPPDAVEERAALEAIVARVRGEAREHGSR